ncbi:molybdate ABC transporter permease subunit, partial [Vibrio sp. D173a]|nr:molybdate ABC transporter permease subunit [Vibrio sp. D173a]
MFYLSDYEYQALLLSFKVAGFAIIWLIPIGICLAWLLAKKQFIGKGLVESLVHLPLVLPPVVIGYLLLVMMGKQGIIGSWLNDVFGLVFSFSWKGASLACIVVALPLMVRSIR